ncbi:hypothetical protein [Halomonas maura]|uniref:hypothetical protein n=1 Tax=Halomonas maura TaxID=117606 RepID=UPI0025B622B0|nr:hypothetical protein [Halomonas maura]MDN3556509.1 hypothetical protein [Halomonas maura]
MQSLSGRWRITWMETWPQDYVDLTEPGYVQFSGNEGEFLFGAVHGWMNVRYSVDKRRAEFSWQGDDEGDECSGRGWVVLGDSEDAEGQLFIHMGDESAMTLRKEP